MDQAKIGKFIAECRKNKNMTQQELAEKLNVSDRTIGNWENGRNMPDLSLFKPLCKELNISLNDLMSGEIVTEKDYQEKLEENIINLTVKNTKQVNKKIKIFSLLIFVLLVFLIIIVFIYRFYEINVKYDERLMKCSFDNNTLTYRIIGNSVLNTNFIERVVDDDKYLLFHSTINIYNKQHSNWEYGESLASIVDNKKIPFGFELTFEQENNQYKQINVYYTDKPLKDIAKMTDNELKKELTKSFKMCSNEV